MLKKFQGKSNTADTVLTALLVSDASPLIALKHMEILEKLNTLFQIVMVPPAVIRELNVKEGEYFANLRFLKIENSGDVRLVKALRLMVDEGEAEAIALALERNAFLLIDDLKGRKVARSLEVEILGTRTAEANEAERIDKGSQTIH